MQLKIIFVLSCLVISVINCFENVYYKDRYTALISGPSWLTIHRAIELTTTPSSISSSKVIVDFIPADATNPQTLISLIIGQSVPGNIRINTNTNTNNDSNDDSNDDFINNLNEYIKTCDTTLNLYNNNCYSFTDNIVNYYSAKKI